jgi:hypothetical protein
MRRTSLFFAVIASILLTFAATAPAQTSRTLGANRIQLDDATGPGASNSVFISNLNGSVGIDATGSPTGTFPSACALLDLSSTSKGFLAPRMTFAQILAICGGAPPEGLIAYDLTNHTLDVYNGSAWGPIAGWTLRGNTIASGGTPLGGSYIGTNNAQDFVMATNGVEQARIDATGRMAIDEGGANAINAAWALTVGAVGGQSTLNTGAERVVGLFTGIGGANINRTSGIATNINDQAAGAVNIGFTGGTTTISTGGAGNLVLNGIVGDPLPTQWLTLNASNQVRVTPLAGIAEQGVSFVNEGGNTRFRLGDLTNSGEPLLANRFINTANFTLNVTGNSGGAGTTYASFNGSNDNVGINNNATNNGATSIGNTTAGGAINLLTSSPNPMTLDIANIANNLTINNINNGSNTDIGFLSLSTGGINANSGNARLRSIGTIITGSQGVQVEYTGSTADAHFAKDNASVLFTSTRYINTSNQILNITSGSPGANNVIQVNGANNAVNVNTVGYGLTQVGNGAGANTQLQVNGAVGGLVGAAPYSNGPNNGWDLYVGGDQQTAGTLKVGTASIVIDGNANPESVTGFTNSLLLSAATAGKDVIINTTGGNVATAKAAGNLDIPVTATPMGLGTISQNGNRLIHTYNGVSNFFAGTNAGNYTMGGAATGNTGIGQSALTAVTTGNGNTAIGNVSMQSNTTGQFNTSVGNSTLISNTSGSSNIAIGSSAMTNNTSGGNNTAVGTSSLFANTTGIQNTAVGTGALTSNTAGSSSTAVGYQALLANTASGNTGVGAQALLNNTTGPNNTAVGNSALLANTIGAANTATGSAALNANSTGSNNTADGVSALQANTVGVNNTALGFQSLIANTTGTNNTATGTSSLQSNTTGSGNTANGVNALFSNTASNNTAVGFASMQNNTTGIQNTAVGSGALTTNASNSNNTAIGFNSLTASVASNNTALGALTMVNNTTGANNTAVGVQALNVNTTGSNNTAVGISALLNNNATGNTAVGFSALAANTSGSSNTATGQNALTSNTTGSSNTANGNGALQGNSTGANNTAVGNVSLTANTTGTSNTSVGASSLAANTTGNQNTSVGNAALAAVTSGSANTAVGYLALNSSTASSNTAVGTSSMQNNTTGTSNAALGVNSLASNTTGNSNTATGASALSSNTTGGSNTANGASALQNNTTGNQNTAVGNQSLQSNTIGTLNSGVGHLALATNTTGNSNTANGSLTLQNNTSGSINTAMGGSALNANTTGNDNTAVGASSLGANTTGTFNTAIGVNAGTAIVAGTQNTFVGNGANASADMSNASAIGAGATVAQANSLILGNTAGGTQVGIGINAPTGIFEVRGATNINNFAGATVTNIGSTTNTGSVVIASNAAPAATAITLNVTNTANNMDFNNILQDNTQFNVLALTGANSGHVRTLNMSLLANEGIVFSLFGGSNAFRLGSGAGDPANPFLQNRAISLNGFKLSFLTGNGAGQPFVTFDASTSTIGLNNTAIGTNNIGFAGGTNTINGITNVNTTTYNLTTIGAGAVDGTNTALTINGVPNNPQGAVPYTNGPNQGWDLYVNGDAQTTGISKFGTASIIVDPTPNTITGYNANGLTLQTTAAAGQLSMFATGGAPIAIQATGGNGAMTLSTVGTGNIAIGTAGGNISMQTSGAGTIGIGPTGSGQVTVSEVGNHPITISAVGGAVGMTSSTGNVTVGSAGGTVFVQNTTGNIQTSTTSGNMTFNATTSGTIQLGNSTTVGALSAPGATLDVRGSVAMNVITNNLAVNYPVAATDYVIVCTNAANGQVNLPAAPNPGRVVIVKSAGAGNVSVNPGANNIDGVGAAYLIVGGGNSSRTFVYTNQAPAGWYIIGF